MFAKFEKDLKELALLSEDSFHEQVLQKVGNPLSEQEIIKVHHFIMLLPSFMKRIYLHWEKDLKKSRMKSVSGYMLSYLYNPKDLFYVEKKSLLSFLDDAYFVSIVFEHCISEMILMGAEPSSNDWSLIEKIDQTRFVVKKLIPLEVELLETMLFDLVSGDFKAYEKLFQGNQEGVVLLPA